MPIREGRLRPHRSAVLTVLHASDLVIVRITRALVKIQF